MAVRDSQDEVPELSQQLAVENDRLKKEFTLLRYTSKHRQIMVPNFETTSSVFNQHLNLLTDLKHRLILLRQAYE
jgi:hypothetical protein